MFTQWSVLIKILIIVQKLLLQNYSVIITFVCQNRYFLNPKQNELKLQI